MLQLLNFPLALHLTVEGLFLCSLCASMPTLTQQETLSYITERAARHDLTAADIFSMLPESVTDCHIETYALLSDKHLSHKLAQSTHPELASDPSNIILEDGSINVRRGANAMTVLEEAQASLDLEMDAAIIDQRYTCDGDPDWLDLVSDLIESAG